MRTSEVAKRAGVSPDTIRLYERRGLVPHPRRTATGYRQYPEETVARVQLVRRALAIGFTLDELRVVLATRDRGEAPCRAVRAIAREKLEALDAHIDDLTVLRDRMRAVLREWDARLEGTPRDRPAGLLMSLAQIAPETQESSFCSGRRLRGSRSS